VSRRPRAAGGRRPCAQRFSGGRQRCSRASMAACRLTRSHHELDGRLVAHQGIPGRWGSRNRPRSSAAGSK
jgi:hypothetical protein